MAPFSATSTSLLGTTSIVIASAKGTKCQASFDQNTHNIPRKMTDAMAYNGLLPARVATHTYSPPLSAVILWMVSEDLVGPSTTSTFPGRKEVYLNNQVSVTAEVASQSKSAL